MTPWLGRSPGEGNVNPFQYSCLENPMDQRSLVGYGPCGHQESDTNGRPILITDKPVSRAFRKYSHSVAKQTPLSLATYHKKNLHFSSLCWLFLVEWLFLGNLCFLQNYLQYLSATILETMLLLLTDFSRVRLCTTP